MSLPIQLITDILASAIAIYPEMSEVDKLVIPIGFCYPNFGCHYTSAIAYQLSSKLTKSPLEIAQIIYSELPLSSKLAIAITDDGMINFTLNEAYIRECLEAIEIGDLSLNCTPKSQNFPRYTHTQYAYARACSLLRLVQSSPIKSQGIKTSISMPELALWLIAIAENIHQSNNLSNRSMIKHCQNLTVKFLEYSDRTVLSDISELQIHLIQITKKLLYILASGYINLPEYL